MRRSMVLLATLMLLGLPASSASALSCIEPEPIDWQSRLPGVEAAVIGVVESVKSIEGDELLGEFALRVRVTESLLGRSPDVLEYSVPNFEPWGPYYQVGQEIAIVIEDGEISDGVMEICGPWFGSEELRQAVEKFTDQPPVIEVPGLDRFMAFLETILKMIVGWYR